ncbi:MAG: hypothetical protein LC641_02180 [Spirochaeta sp.]|nr:hypothetical protein [Spirochaeta sp.]
MSQHNSHDDIAARGSSPGPAAAAHGGEARADGPNGSDAEVTVFAPPALDCAGSNTWESAVLAFEHRFAKRYGNKVHFTKADLFSPEFFQNPAVMEAVQNGGTAPIIAFNGRVIQSGGKLSERVIREELEKLGIQPIA